MSTPRSFVMLAVISIATIQAITSGADAANLSLVGSSMKVCQLVGDTDWATGNPTAARTLSNFGLDAIDLGFPVDSGPPGPLYFLFGDALPPGHPPNSILSVPPDDAVGSTTRTNPPDSTACLDLQLLTSAPKTFAHPTVQPTIQQGTFNVPSGGVFLNNSFYAFFWTDHCAFPSGLSPEPRTPLRRPPPSGACLENPESSSVGRSVLAEATSANPLAFNWTPAAGGWLFRNMPSGFVYASAAVPPPSQPSDVPVFGVARYRASIPYLAMAPRATFGDPQTWSFFAGREEGHPIWLTRREWERNHNAAGEWVPPPGAGCIGEHSATWKPRRTNKGPDLSIPGAACYCLLNTRA